MLDFKELPASGQKFEQLVREMLLGYGLQVMWSGNGPDGGRDLLCIENTSSLFASKSQIWLIQCKHFAHVGRSVGISDLGDIITPCVQHGASGYMLVCSTQPSSAVVNTLEAVISNQTNTITASYWDAVAIERLLSTPVHWPIAQRFFQFQPVTGDSTQLKGRIVLSVIIRDMLFT